MWSVICSGTKHGSARQGRSRRLAKQSYEGPGKLFCCKR
jgi:hypothetical protein